MSRTGSLNPLDEKGDVGQALLYPSQSHHVASLASGPVRPRATSHKLLARKLTPEELHAIRSEATRKGNLSRAMSPKLLDHLRRIGPLGGAALEAKYSPEELTEIGKRNGRKGALKRWGPTKPPKPKRTPEELYAALSVAGHKGFLARMETLRRRKGV